ncbi:reverse transcriptase N-terminal domain-containing protein [Limnospira platensis]|uniref:reverse transcriptase N-terminal domain-containing protein n=1 Tax=Limnospira platensis TaxID=118562 RepID=UPI0002804360|nr:putative RNA-directed DNA polymerase [Arthrospira platensis C1]UWU46318.1 RNA-directed DNA polymerase [Arthrospira platensis C1]
MNTVKPMYGWETINWKKVEYHVFKLQKRIYRASERGDVKAVRRLQRLLTNAMDAKILAVRELIQDNGTEKRAGVDGVNRLRNQEKLDLANCLKLGKKTQTSRQVSIPEPGKEEKPAFGILMMMEKAKQGLVKLALEPEWEAKFDRNSYGFRPGRSAQDAIAAIFNGIKEDHKYVLDAHIEKCCEGIYHQKLLAKLNTYPRLRRPIKAWLKSGVMDGKELFPTETDTPQGGLMPLLANIALDGLESLLEDTFKGGVANCQNGKATVVRYADDLVVLDEELAVILTAQETIEAWLGEMGLKLKDSNTRITHTFTEHNGNLGWDFLGYNIRQYPTSKKRSLATGNTEQKIGCQTIIKPSKEAIKRHLQKIDEIIGSHKNSSQEQLINALNPIIRGWSSYYSTVSSKETFGKIDSILFHKLRGWAFFRRNRNQNNTDVISSYWGVNQGIGWKFITPDHKYCLEKHSQTLLKQHVKVKGEKSPFDGDYVYWSERLLNYPGATNAIEV